VTRTLLVGSAPVTAIYKHIAVAELLPCSCVCVCALLLRCCCVYVCMLLLRYCSLCMCVDSGVGREAGSGGEWEGRERRERRRVGR